MFVHPFYAGRAFSLGNTQMPLIEKEVIRPGTYFYRDESTGAPRKLVVTPELTRYWHEQGNAMLATGLTVPVPCEHDFNAHPMTSADRLKNNAGWVAGYTLKGDKLFSSVNITNPEITEEKLRGSIRWTSPWINSFVDGKGKEWKNVISHLALTTRPRIVEQQPFGSVAAALSVAHSATLTDAGKDNGFCLSNAGRLATRKSDKRVMPRYPMAFSMLTGIALGSDDMPPPKGKKPPMPPGKSSSQGDDGDEYEEDSDGDGEADADEGNIDLEPFGDPAGDVKMEELLCDLLGALGIQCQHAGDPEQFKRELYNAAMTKIHELTGKNDPKQQPQQPNRANPPGQPPNNPQQKPGQTNPLIQQEQQPMYMSLDEINKLDEPLKSVALSMHNAMSQANAREAEATKRLNSLTQAELAKANEARIKRVNLITRFMPRVKSDLDAMLSNSGMALSMGDGGQVIDPMAQTLSVLEKGLQDLPKLLTTDASALSVQPQPQDADMLTDARSDEISDVLAKAAGLPARKAS